MPKVISPFGLWTRRAMVEFSPPFFLGFSRSREPATTHTKRFAKFGSMRRVNNRIDLVNTVLIVSPAGKPAMPVAFAGSQLVKVVQFKAAPRAFWGQAFVGHSIKLPNKNVPFDTFSPQNMGAELTRQLIAEPGDLKPTLYRFAEQVYFFIKGHLFTNLSGCVSENIPIRCCWRIWIDKIQTTQPIKMLLCCFGFLARHTKHFSSRLFPSMSKPGRQNKNYRMNFLMEGNKSCPS